MSPIAKSKLFWLIWLVVAIGVIWWFSCQCSGAYITIYRKTILSPKAREQAIPVRILAPRLPAIPALPPDVFYFAATAYQGILESEFSKEAVYTNAGNNSELTLAWDASPGSVDGYRIYKGWSSGLYDIEFQAGTNLALRVWLYSPILSNCVVNVTSRNATNLQWAAKLGQPWALVGETNWTATNPPNRYWRAVGRSTVNRPQVFITRKWQ